MREKRKHVLTVLLPGLIILGFALIGILKTDVDYSMTERRVLAKLPKVANENVLSGKFMNDFEMYTQDQFPGRDTFRTIKAMASRYVFGQKDNHGYYWGDGYLSKLEYPMNESRIDASLKKQQGVYDAWLKDTDCNIYVSVIPDKNYFLAPKCGYLTMDYDKYVEKVKAGAAYGIYVDLFDTLELDSFYRTDQHWKQEKLEPVVKKLANAMQIEVKLNTYKECLLDTPFYGAYYAQAALTMKSNEEQKENAAIWPNVMSPVQPDELRYLTNPVLEECVVTSYNTGKPKTAKMYDLEKAHGKDPYEMFVSGSDALVVIENPNIKQERELILFRDSFGSSLAPLLVNGYSKITLVDLRYIRSELLGQFMDFEGADVLFLYSTLVF